MLGLNLLDFGRRISVLDMSARLTAFSKAIDWTALRTGVILV
jgi:hypothetical protein